MRCVICGKPLRTNQPHTLTCSSECRVCLKALRDERRWEEIKSNPERYAKHLARFRERYGSDDNFREACLARAKALSELRRQSVGVRWANGGRPKGKIVALRCPEAEAVELRGYARKARVAPSEALRRAIQAFLPSLENR